MKIQLPTCFVILMGLINVANASVGDISQDWFFHNVGGELLLCDDIRNCYRADGSIVNLNDDTQQSLATEEDDVRIRIYNTHSDATKFSGSRIVRPVLLIDGIQLEDKEKTLTMFTNELETGADGKAKRFIITNLQELGYSPIVVQFGATAKRNMEENAKTFSRLLTFLASNAFLGWQDADAQKFLIMGFSQGGVIGRYGAYLYDKSRGVGPGIRMLLTIDSPHQGAVLPRSLLASVDFWVRNQARGGDVAQGFMEILESEAVNDLLIYNTKMETDANTPSVFAPNFSATRWLFGEYRNAAEYKGFPVVMLSDGLLSGHRNFPSASAYYLLNRKSLFTSTDNAWGRATSNVYYTESNNEEYAYNHVYEYTKQDKAWPRYGSARWDLVQGSVYPFNKTIYNVLHGSFLSSMKDNDEVDLGYGFLLPDPDIRGEWGSQDLNFDSTTFIPTVSALDMKCSGNLSVFNECAFSMNESNTTVNWESPGSLSTGKSIYAIDATHPRSSHTSGQYHVFGSDPVDYWRLFCELMKSDVENGAFQNTELNSRIGLNQSCLDQAAIPNWFLNQYNITSRYKYPIIKWLYNSAKNNKDGATFGIPPAWNPVATFNSTRAIRKGDVIEVTMNAPKTFGWLFLDFVLLRKSDGTGWLQLGEKKVIADGENHVYTWVVPEWMSETIGYTWSKLIMNSLNGGTVTISKVRVGPATGTVSAETAVPMSEASLYPGYNGQWSFGDWGDHDLKFQDNVGTWLHLKMPNYYDGAMWETSSKLSTSSYKNLVIYYKPNTCRNTIVYFDTRTYWTPRWISAPLPLVEKDNFYRMGSFTRKTSTDIWQEVIPLSSIDGADGLVKRLVLQSEPFATYNTIGGVRLSGSEDCYIQSANFTE